jgi:serine protease Do
VTPDQTLTRLVSNLQPGTTARFEVLRGGQPVSINIQVATRPSNDQLKALANGGEDSGGFGPNDAQPGGDDDSDGTTQGSTAPLGLNVQPLTPGIARAIGVDPTVQGLVIATVDAGSDAAGKLKRGDVIQAINGTPVRTNADMARIVAQAKAAGRPQVLLLVQRGRGNPAFIAIKVK